MTTRSSLPSWGLVTRKRRITHEHRSISEKRPRTTIKNIRRVTPNETQKNNLKRNGSSNIIAVLFIILRDDNIIDI